MSGGFTKPGTLTAWSWSSAVGWTTHVKARLRVQLEMAYEIPRAYPYTRAQMLDILQKNVSDFAEEELETLRDDGTLDWRYVNGEVRFKNNALSALLKTRKEYAMRATDPAVMSGAKASTEQLSAMIAKMKANGGVRARFELHEELTVRSDRLTEGETPNCFPRRTPSRSLRRKTSRSARSILNCRMSRA